MTALASIITSYGSLLVAGAIIFSALVGGGIAIWAILAQKATARKRLALETLINAEEKTYYQENRKIFLEVRNSTEGFSELVRVLKHEQTSNAAIQRQIAGVNYFLNHYEIICVGIHKGIIDERICESWMRSAIIRHWEEAEEFISAVREKNPRIYAFLKSTIDRWIGNMEKEQKEALKKAIH